MTVAFDTSVLGYVERVGVPAGPGLSATAADWRKVESAPAMIAAYRAEGVVLPAQVLAELFAS